MDILTVLGDWIGRAADVLSLLTFLAAASAWWKIRQITARYHALIRIPEQVEELDAAAFKIVKVAPTAGSSRDAVLEGMSEAEGKLASLRGKIGGRFFFWDVRRELILEMLALGRQLKSHQEENAPMNPEIARAAYRRISKVAVRITDYVEDQRLGH